MIDNHRVLACGRVEQSIEEAMEEIRDGLPIEVLPGVFSTHYMCCGIPPKLDLKHPTGHFRNEWNELGVMQFDMETGICRVWMGDCGWENEIRAEEFRGRLLIHYFGPRHERLPDWTPDPEFEREYRTAADQVFGELDDAEFELISSTFFMGDCEYQAIKQFYESNMAAFEKLERKRYKEKQKAEREAERVADRERRRLLKEQKQAETERLWAEGRAKRQQEIEQLVEVSLIKEQIKTLKDLTRKDLQSNHTESEEAR